MRLCKMTRMSIHSICLLALLTTVHGLPRYNDPGYQKDENYDNKPTKQQGKYGTNQYQNDGNVMKNLIRSMHQTLLRHPVILTKLESAIQSVQKHEYSSDHIFDDPWECLNPGLSICEFGTTEHQLQDAVGGSLTGDSNTLLGAADDDCAQCMANWEWFQSLACNDSLSWETICDFLIPVCEELWEQRGDDPVVCNGSLTLQGRHAYCVMREITPRAMCETFNECYPPDTRDRPPVSERTPWAIKAKMEQAGRTPKERSTKPRKNRDELLMVAQLTDIHMQEKHQVGLVSDCIGSICCLEDSIGTGSAREYGEYRCNLPPRTRDLFLHRVSKANPDFVIYAGDSPPHTSWDETLTSQLNCSQLVINAMLKEFPEGLKVYPTIGNHEMFPTNLYSLRMEETQAMLDEFVRMWHSIAGFDSEANTTMSDLSYYTMTVPGHPKLRIMSINSLNDWYTANLYCALNHGSEENLRHKQWVNNTLLAARDAQEKVIIISHVPIGGGSTKIETARWWEEISNEYNDVIIMHVAGHEHNDNFKLNFDPHTMEATGVNTVLASTTSNNNINPTMRMFYLDPDEDYRLVDFENFYLDIKLQNQSRGVPPAIAFSYNAVDYYGLPDLSPNSYKELVLRFIDDEELFAKYYANKDSHARDNACDYQCKVSELCRIWFPEESEAEECKTLASLMNG